MYRHVDVTYNCFINVSSLFGRRNVNTVTVNICHLLVHTNVEKVVFFFLLSRLIDSKIQLKV